MCNLHTKFQIFTKIVLRWFTDEWAYKQTNWRICIQSSICPVCPTADLLNKFEVITSYSSRDILFTTACEQVKNMFFVILIPKFAQERNVRNPKVIFCPIPLLSSYENILFISQVTLLVTVINLSSWSA